MSFARTLRFCPFVFLATPWTAYAQDAPLNYFLHAHGPAAQPTLVLGWVLAFICMAVCLIIAVLLLWAILRKRPNADKRAIGRESEGVRWIYIGTGISTAVLFALVVYALKALDDVASPPAAPGLTITVTGYDWWWQAEYEDKAPLKRFVTANEIHIPVGIPVQINLKSADVIHAFWVPQLAGKTQMIPGQMNRQWLQADQPGIYRGQCTQFCGVQHAHMALEVVAQNAADFTAWETAQRQPALTPENSEAQNGQRVFIGQCAGCHAVRGSAATGGHAPDLTHLASRRLIAAGLLTNTPEHLADWVAHAQALKPGCRMPDMPLSMGDASALSSYLATLR